jgi:multidrug resistance efflux pump
MLEIALCSLFTILPDYLYRRYAQGKRIGYEITQYSVWFELRWGITACLMLSVLLIAIIFYNHPSTSSVTAYFRTIPILTETTGRVTEVYVKSPTDMIEKGAPIFKVDSTKEEADLDVAKRRIAEIDATMVMAEADISAAEGQIVQARGAYEQALDELTIKTELRQRNADVVTVREIERLQNAVDGRKGAVTAAEAARQAAQTRLSTLLPAEKASAEATLRQAQVELDKKVIYAGVSGRVEQFILRVGDIVSPVMRPAGLLIPAEAGRKALFAGFGQIEAQVIKPGMAAEVTCISKPLTIIPMVVTKPGTLLVTLEPLYDDGLAGVTPGSSCVANAYTSNHDRLETEDLGFFSWLYLHMVDAVGVVHAVILRAQALMLPIKTLVLGGH